MYSHALCKALSYSQLLVLQCKEEGCHKVATASALVTIHKHAYLPTSLCVNKLCCVNQTGYS